jgi:hypothetical protein
MVEIIVALLLANPTFQRHWILWSHKMRSEVTLTGGSGLALPALAARQRSRSRSGWKVCEICGATQEMIHYNYRRGTQSISVFIVKHRYRYRVGTPTLFGSNRPGTDPDITASAVERKHLTPKLASLGA